MPAPLWGWSPGIAGLAALLSSYAPQVEADLHRYYNVDLLDLWRPDGRLSGRKVLRLVEQLPPESATHTAIRVAGGHDAAAGREADPTELPWSHTQMLIADLIDAITGLHHTYVAAHSKKRPPTPKPVRRPGVDAIGTRGRGPTGGACGLTVADYERLVGEPPPGHLITGS